MNVKFNSNKKSNVSKLSDTIFEYIKDKENINIVCVGSDKNILDSVAPIVGYNLNKSISKLNGVNIYGKVGNTVNATNLTKYVELIKNNNSNNQITIAIDSAMGYSDVGTIFFKDTPLKAGSAVGKNLPKIGDIQIMAITTNNVSDFNSGISVIIGDSLNTILVEADFIHNALLKAIKKYNKYNKLKYKSEVA